jgi:hypothetical protein
VTSKFLPSSERPRFLCCSRLRARIAALPISQNVDAFFQQLRRPASTLQQAGRLYAAALALVGWYLAARPIIALIRDLSSPVHEFKVEGGAITGACLAASSSFCADSREASMSMPVNSAVAASNACCDKRLAFAKSRSFWPQNM